MSTFEMLPILPLLSTTNIIYGVFALLVLSYLSKLRPIQLIHARENSFLKDGTLNSVRSLHSTIVPPPWCWSSSCQIIFFLLRNMWCDRSVDFRDEDIHTERGTVKLSWAEEEPENSDPPVLLFLHGKFGCRSWGVVVVVVVFGKAGTY